MIFKNLKLLALGTKKFRFLQKVKKKLACVPFIVGHKRCSLPPPPALLNKCEEGYFVCLIIIILIIMSYIYCCFMKIWAA